jgi:hypothetical protein
MHMPTLLLVLLSFFAAPALSHAQDAGRGQEAMVVVLVHDLDDAQLARLATQVGRQKNCLIEYSCTWSGVVVLKFNQLSVVDRADVVVLARRQLAEAGITGRTEVLHVHVEAGGTGKC